MSKAEGTDAPQASGDFCRLQAPEGGLPNR